MTTTLAPPSGRSRSKVQRAGWALYEDRCQEVDDARAALAAGNVGDRPALRQALQDLAAAAAALAARMPAPTVRDDETQQLRWGRVRPPAYDNAA